MDLGQLSLVVSIATFVGVIVSNLLSNWVTARNAQEERKHALREMRLEYLKGILDGLVSIRSHLHLARVDEGLTNPEIERAYGEAYGLMVSVFDKKMKEILKEFPYMGENRTFVVSGNRYVKTIDNAIERIGELIFEIMDMN